jgi:plastocyanin
MNEDNSAGKSDYGKRPLWQWLAIYAVIGIVLYGVIYYFFLAGKGGYSASPTTYATPGSVNQPAETLQPMPPPASASQSPGPAGQITIEGTEFAFSPSTLTVTVGQPVQITFKNGGAYSHNLTITALGVKTKTIQPGQEDTISFTPAKAGQYPFICTVPGHADKGMKGTLIVQ